MEILNKKLNIIGLTKIIEKKTILEDINFFVEDGEFLSILGPSGCGKTTIIRIIIGLTEPSAGKIYKDQVDITAMHPSKRGMGIVFQNYALFEKMTVLGNVEYALKLKKETKATAKETAMEMLTQVGLVSHADKLPTDLSGGEQQRVAIARTLVLKPDILLFDEPMSALDAATRLSLRTEIKNIQKTYHTTVIYITHDQEEAFAMSDRIMVMSTSKIHQIDTPENIIKEPADDYVRSFVNDNLQTKIDSLKRFTEIRDEKHSI